MKTISHEELTTRLDRGEPLTLLEALPERYFQEGHLPGARWFPHTEVKERASAELPDKAQPLVVYCASETCRNSHTAAAQLEALGYRDVLVYTAGKAGWTAAGRTLVR